MGRGVSFRRQHCVAASFAVGWPCLGASEKRRKQTPTKYTTLTREPSFVILALFLCYPAAAVATFVTAPAAPASWLAPVAP